MEFKSRVTNKFFGLILILCLTRVSHGKLMCYVCDDCAQVTAQTPQFECNEDFFNTSGPTDSSVQTTTEHTKPTTGMPEATTSTTGGTSSTTSTTSSGETSTTPAQSSESTNKGSSENITETATEMMTETTIPQATDTTTQRSTSTTHQQSPTPAEADSTTVSTPIPTPTYIENEEALDDVDNLNNRTTAHEQDVNKDDVENIDVTNATTKLYKPSAEIRSRQLRSVTDVTYHCFKVEATSANGTMVVNRGCSRIQGNESVCSQWKAQHAEEKMNKCHPCASAKCNGSSALTVSVTALFVAVVAFFMHRK